jgi:hypothetical protein
MGTGRSKRMRVAAAVCSLGAIGALIRGHGSQDLFLALALGGFAAAAIAVGLLTSGSRGPESGPLTSGTVRVEGALIPALQIPYSNRKMKLAALGSLGFVMCGVGMAFAGRLVIGIVTVAFFGAFALMGVHHLIRPSFISLSERGVHMRAGAGQRWVPWDEVETISTYAIHGAPSLSVVGTNGPRIEGGVLASLGVRFGDFAGDLDIPLDAVGVDSERLERLMLELVENPEMRGRVVENAPEELAGAKAA